MNVTHPIHKLVLLISILHQFLRWGFSRRSVNTSRENLPCWFQLDWLLDQRPPPCGVETYIGFRLTSLPEHPPLSQHPPSPNLLLFSAPVNWSRHHPATHALQLQMIECFNQLPFLPNWHENKTHINMSYHQQSTIPFAELDQIPPLAAAAKPPLSSHDKQRIASSNLHSCLILPPPSKWPPAIHACLA